MNKTRSLIFIIGIILLVLLGVAVVYIVYNKANDNNVDSSTYTDSSLDFNGCIDSAKSTCIKNLKLDGKNIKLEISVEKTYIGEKVSDAYVDIKSNGKTILEKGYVSYTSDGEYVITFSMDKTDSLLIFDSCASSFCGIKIVDSDLNIKEITQLDNNLPGMWIKRDRDFANIEKLGNNKFRLTGSREVGQEWELNLTGSGSTFVCENSTLKDQGLTDNTIIGADYEIEYIGNATANINRIEGTEKLYSSIKDEVEDYCEQYND